MFKLKARTKNVKLLILVAIALIPAIPPPSYAQTSPAKLPEFEVASIKPVNPDVPHVVGVEIYPGARIVMSTLPLKTLVAIAFRVSYWQISGGDPWTEKDNYDIQAKPPENLLPRIKTLRYSNYSIEDPRLREMLQALLIDRFQLKFHRETKTGNVYLLQTKGDTSASARQSRLLPAPSLPKTKPKTKAASAVSDSPEAGGASSAPRCLSWQSSPLTMSFTPRSWTEPA